MFFKSKDECASLLETLGHSTTFLEALKRNDPSSASLRVNVSDDATRVLWLARALPRWLRFGSGWLLWLTEYGIWPSRENLHLLCQLRASYGERRSYVDSPGHEFLSYEGADLQSYLTLLMLFGMGGYLVAIGGPGVVFLSHDGWMQITLDEWYEAELRGDIKAFETSHTGH
jgi:hypothetical protein